MLPSANIELMSYSIIYDVRFSIERLSQEKTERNSVLPSDSVSPYLRIFRPMPWLPPTDIVLPNGIRVLCDPVSTVDSCSVGMWVRAGTRDEPQRGDGVAHFVEHTSFRRTRNRTMSKISRDFENVGAYANAYTTKEETCYYVRTLSDHLNRVVDTLTDVVIRPMFVHADVEKERTIITEEIKSYEDEAEEYIFDLGERQMFDGHAIGVPIVGTTQVLSWKIGNRKSRQITAESIGYTSSFAQDSDLVVGVESDPDIENQAILRVVLARTAPKGEVRINWDWNTMDFSEVEDDTNDNNDNWYY